MLSRREARIALETGEPVFYKGYTVTVGMVHSSQDRILGTADGWDGPADLFFDELEPSSMVRYLATEEIQRDIAVLLDGRQ